jgi:hypothetical protein
MMAAQTLAKWSMALLAKAGTINLPTLALKSAEMGLTSASMSVMMATPTLKMVAQAAARLSQAGHAL